MPYNQKLVRDRIPDIIRSHGEIPIYTTLSGEELFHALEQKLNEEVAEFHESHELEELADILEVIYAIASHMGYVRSSLEKLRIDKFCRRGGFEKGFFLADVQQAPHEVLYYEAGIEVPEILGTGYAICNVLRLEADTTEEDAVRFMNQGYNHLARTVRCGDKTICEKYNPADGNWELW